MPDRRSIHSSQSGISLQQYRCFISMTADVRQFTALEATFSLKREVTEENNCSSVQDEKLVDDEDGFVAVVPIPKGGAHIEMIDLCCSFPELFNTCEKAFVVEREKKKHEQKEEKNWEVENAPVTASLDYHCLKVDGITGTERSVVFVADSLEKLKDMWKKGPWASRKRAQPSKKFKENLKRRYRTGFSFIVLAAALRRVREDLRHSERTGERDEQSGEAVLEVVEEVYVQHEQQESDGNMGLIQDKVSLGETKAIDERLLISEPCTGSLEWGNEEEPDWEILDVQQELAANGILLSNEMNNIQPAGSVISEEGQDGKKIARRTSVLVGTALRSLLNEEHQKKESLEDTNRAKQGNKDKSGITAIESLIEVVNSNKPEITAKEHTHSSESHQPTEILRNEDHQVFRKKIMKDRKKGVRVPYQVEQERNEVVQNIHVFIACAHPVKDSNRLYVPCITYELSRKGSAEGDELSYNTNKLVIYSVNTGREGGKSTDEVHREFCNKRNNTVESEQEYDVARVKTTKRESPLTTPVTMVPSISEQWVPSFNYSSHPQTLEDKITWKHLHNAILLFQSGIPSYVWKWIASYGSVLISSFLGTIGETEFLYRRNQLVNKLTGKLPTGTTVSLPIMSHLIPHGFSFSHGLQERTFESGVPCKKERGRGRKIEPKSRSKRWSRIRIEHLKIHKFPVKMSPLVEFRRVKHLFDAQLPDLSLGKVQ